MHRVKRPLDIGRPNNNIIRPAENIGRPKVRPIGNLLDE